MINDNCEVGRRSLVHGEAPALGLFSGTRFFSIAHCFSIVFCFSIAVFFSWVVGTADASAQQSNEELFEIRAHNVSDILRSTNDYSFNGIFLPAANVSSKMAMSSQGGGGFGGHGAGGGGRGMGGGIFSIPSSTLMQTAGGAGSLMSGYSLPVGNNAFPGRADFTMADLESGLSELLQADDRQDGVVITTLGETLLLNAPERLQQRAEAYLDVIRQSISKVRRSVTVSVYWVTNSDPTAFDALEIQMENGVRVVGNVAQLRGMGAATGSVTCFDGQTVHLATGRVKSKVGNVVPVVGQNTNEWSSATELAKWQSHPSVTEIAFRKQIAMEGNPQSNVGYQLESKLLHQGGLLQLTPWVMEGSALLDVQSFLSIEGEERGALSFADIVALDRVDVQVHQFGTSLRMPLGRPVVVGGSTIDVGTNNPMAYYLVVQIDAGK